MEIIFRCVVPAAVFNNTIRGGFVMSQNATEFARRRYVVKHNLITEVYLMNVMENNYIFRPVLAIIRLSMELKV